MKRIKKLFLILIVMLLVTSISYAADTYWSWEEINGNWYYKKGDDIRKDDWVTIDGNKYYVDAEGKRQTGFCIIDGGYYFFGTDGALVKKNFDFTGKTFEVERDGNITNIDSDDEMNSLIDAFKAGNTNFVKRNKSDNIVSSNENISYENVNYKNSTDAGWKEEIGPLGDVVYKYSKDGTNNLTNAWLIDGENTYYFGDDSSMLSGFQEIESKEYFFNVDGILQKSSFNDANNHYDVNGTKYYIEKTTAMDVYKVSTNPTNPDGTKSSEYKGLDTFIMLTAEQQKKVTSKVESIYNSYIKNKFKTTDPDYRFKCSVAIVKWLVENTDYDTVNYNNGTIPDIDYTPYAVFFNKKAVCEGFASAYSLLAAKCGIPVIKVSGIDHAWNIVQLDDDEWYHVDSTWAVCAGNSGIASRIHLTDTQCANLPNGASGVNNHETWNSDVEAKGTKYGGSYLINYLKTTYNINSNGYTARTAADDVAAEKVEESKASAKSSTNVNSSNKKSSSKNLKKTTKKTDEEDENEIPDEDEFSPDKMKNNQ